MGVPRTNCLFCIGNSYYINGRFRGTLIYGNYLLITIQTCHVHTTTSKTMEELPQLRAWGHIPWPEHPEQTNCTNAKSPISGQHLPYLGMLLSSSPAREGLRALTFQGCSDASKCLPCAQEPWKLQLLVLARTWPLGKRCKRLRLQG